MTKLWIIGNGLFAVRTSGMVWLCNKCERVSSCMFPVLVTEIVIIQLYYAFVICVRSGNHPRNSLEGIVAWICRMRTWRLFWQPLLIRPRISALRCLLACLRRCETSCRPAGEGTPGPLYPAAIPVMFWLVIYFSGMAGWLNRGHRSKTSTGDLEPSTPRVGEGWSHRIASRRHAASWRLVKIIASATETRLHGLGAGRF